MSTNVLKHLESRAPRLADKAGTSEELSKIFMALIQNLVNICNKKAISLRDVRFGAPYIDARRMKAKIFFEGGTTSQGFQTKSTFFEYISAKNMRMAKALEENPELDKFFAKMVETADSYCYQKSRRFGSLRIEHGFIDANDTLVLELNFR